MEKNSDYIYAVRWDLKMLFVRAMLAQILDFIASSSAGFLEYWEYIISLK
jgi:hypothetical protein